MTVQAKIIKNFGSRSSKVDDFRINLNPLYATFLLLILTSTADDLSGGTNIDDFERPWNRQIAGF